VTSALVLSALLSTTAMPALADPPAASAAPVPAASAVSVPAASAAPVPAASAVPVPAASAAPVPAPTTPPPIVNGAAANLRPFGPGTRVTVETSKLAKVYVGRALPDGSAPPDYEFKRVGTAPITLELPAGAYIVAVENDDVSRADHLLRVGTQPAVLDVSPGSSGLGGVGTLTLGVGILSVLAATVLLISGSDAPAGIDKPKLVIPMYAAGGALVVGGLTMYLVSRTSIKERPGPVPPPAPRASAGLGFRARLEF